jgi:DNA-directed RNA polymerase subunit RPC12/RpoP
MYDLKFLCEHCEKPLEADLADQGKTYQCPHCNCRINVPSATVETESGKTWDTYLKKLPKGETGDPPEPRS